MTFWANIFLLSFGPYLAASYPQFDAPEVKLNVPEPNEETLSNGLAGLLGASLLTGTALAVFSPKRENNIDRSGFYEDPTLTYVQNINRFENRVLSKLRSGFSTVGRSAKVATKKLNNAMRRTGQRSLNVVKAGATGVARAAHATNRGLRGIARSATQGLRRIGSRVGRVGAGSIERIGTSSTSLSTAAVRGLYRVSKAYVKGIEKARKATIDGLHQVGNTYKRGISRVGSVATGLAHAYTRGVKRMGSAASRYSISDVASDGISRLGELASQGAAKVGGIATEVADVATSVPKSISQVAQDQKMRNCLLQAICYISTPFIDPNSNYVKRSAQLLDEEGQKQLEEMAVNLSKLNGDNILRMEDCEAFECKVVSMGRKAYDLVAKAMRKVDEE